MDLLQFNPNYKNLDDYAELLILNENCRLCDVIYCHHFLKNIIKLIDNNTDDEKIVLGKFPIDLLSTIINKFKRNELMKCELDPNHKKNENNPLYLCKLILNHSKVMMNYDYLYECFVKNHNLVSIVEYNIMNKIKHSDHHLDILLNSLDDLSFTKTDRREDTKHKEYFDNYRNYLRMNYNDALSKIINVFAACGIVPSREKIMEVINKGYNVFQNILINYSNNSDEKQQGPNEIDLIISQINTGTVDFKDKTKIVCDISNTDKRKISTTIMANASQYTVKQVQHLKNKCDIIFDNEDFDVFCQKSVNKDVFWYLYKSVDINGKELRPSFEAYGTLLRRAGTYSKILKFLA
ncbi:MAG: hypothetical protein Terrestrivirus1_136 [Terrestrivirus sp.]|uniref:Uncharacterized protein n=1 Tax=Terrestrivirus sp. TaxID=2487775 RepID=A0A3G4ZK94_9VIRU|nr:MAG: hypothetical protein Terrestrivirus1_136 [Terrestrivirus sp.]